MYVICTHWAALPESLPATYIRAMFWSGSKTRERNPAPASFIDPCLPTRATGAPAGSDWAHEIKHDGYRLQIHVGNGGVRLYTISGYNWTDRYPGIVKAASRIKSSMIIDAEVVIQGPDGVTDFEALHGRARNAEAFAYVFDILSLEGADLRHLTMASAPQRTGAHL
jgi:ATP-dependent DNA ligase